MSPSSAIVPFCPQPRGSLSGAGHRLQLPLEQANSVLELFVLVDQLIAPLREVTIVPPPVQADLFRLIDRADHQPDADGEKLDLGDRDLDVASDDQALVEHPVKNVDEAACARVADGFVRHNGR